MSDPMGKMFEKLYNKILNDIAQDWKNKTDETIKLMKNDYRHLSKRCNRLVDSYDFEKTRYNQLIHSFNMERSSMETLITTLQTKIEKLKDKEEIEK